MFEKFSKKAREVLVAAQEDAQARSAARIGTEHLLRALLTEPDHRAADVLAEFGVDRAGVEVEIENQGRTDLTDAEALATLGIDLEEVRRRTEEEFGPGALEGTSAAARPDSRHRKSHIPFDVTTKKVLELALQEAGRLRHNYIGTEHILLGMLHSDTGTARDVLESRGVGLDPARLAVVEHIARGEQAS